MYSDFSFYLYYINNQDSKISKTLPLRNVTFNEEARSVDKCLMQCHPYSSSGANEVDVLLFLGVRNIETAFSRKSSIVGDWEVR